MKKQLKKYLSMLLAFVMVCSCFPAMPMEAEETPGSEKRYSWDFQDAVQAKDFDFTSTTETNAFSVADGVLTTNSTTGSYMKAITKESYNVGRVSVDISPVENTDPLDAHILLGVTGESSSDSNKNDMIDIRWADANVEANGMELKIYQITNGTRNIVFYKWIPNDGALYTGNEAQAVHMDIDVIGTKLIITITLLSTISSTATTYKQYIVDISKDIYSDDGLAPALGTNRLNGRIGFAVDGQTAKFDNLSVKEKYSSAYGLRTWDFGNATQVEDFKLTNNGAAEPMSIGDGCLNAAAPNSNSGYSKAVLETGYDLKSVSVDIHKGATNYLAGWLALGVKGQVGVEKRSQGGCIYITWEDKIQTHNQIGFYIYYNNGSDNNVTKLYDFWISANSLYTSHTPESINMKVDIDGTKLVITLSSYENKSLFIQKTADIALKQDGSSSGLNENVLLGRVGLICNGWRYTANDYSTVGTASFDNLTIIEQEESDTWDFTYGAQANDFGFTTSSTSNGSLLVDTTTGYLTPGTTSGYKHAFLNKAYDNVKSFSVDVYPLAINKTINEETVAVKIVRSDIFFGLQGDNFVGNQYANTIRLVWSDYSADNNWKQLTLIHYNENKTSTVLAEWNSMITDAGLYAGNDAQPVNITVNLKDTTIEVTVTVLDGSSIPTSYTNKVDVTSKGFTSDIFEGRIGLGSMSWVASGDETARAQFDNLTLRTYNTDDKGGYDLAENEKMWETTNGLSVTPNTVEAWVKVPVDTLSDEKGVILSAQPEIPSIDLKMGTYGRPYFTWRDADGTVQQVIAEDIDLRTGRWTHIAVVRDVDNDKFVLYVDGEIVKEIKGVTVEDIDVWKLYLGRNDARQSWPIDGSTTDQQRFPGKIADVRVWSNALSQPEVKSSMSKDKMAQSEALLLNVSLDTLNIDNTFTDESQYNNTIVVKDDTLEWIDGSEKYYTWDFSEESQKNDFTFVADTNGATDPQVIDVTTGRLAGGDSTGYNQVYTNDSYKNVKSISVDVYPTESSTEGINNPVNIDLYFGLNEHFTGNVYAKKTLLRLNWFDLYSDSVRKNAYLDIYDGSGTRAQRLDCWSVFGDRDVLYSEKDPQPINIKLDIEGSVVQLTVSPIDSDSTYKPVTISHDISKYTGYSETIFDGYVGLGTTGWVASGYDATARAHFDNLKIMTYDPQIEEEDYSVVVIPDQQVLSRYQPDKLNSLYQWIADNAETENIKYVLNLGDLADSGVKEEVLKANMEASKNAYDIIAAKNIPMALVPGNHDYNETTGYRNTDVLNSYFNAEKGYGTNENITYMTEGEVENSYHTFTANEGTMFEQKYLIVALEYGARDSVIEWANDVIQKHADYQVIVMTHGYLNYDGTLLNAATKHAASHSSYLKTAGEEAPNDADALWTKLISQHENIIMVLSGHIGTDDVVVRTDKGVNGNDVVQMLVDGQHRDAENGCQGVGLLGIMRFDGTSGEMTFKYFSPLQGKDGSTVKYLGIDNQFDLTLPVQADRLVINGLATRTVLNIKDQANLPTGYVDDKFIINWTLNGKEVDVFDEGQNGYTPNFADPEMLDVCYQTSYDSAEAGATKYDIRFISSLNGYADYEEAGFLFMSDTKYTEDAVLEINATNTAKVSTKKLYTSLHASGKTLSAVDYYGNNYQQYFFTFEMTGIPAEKALYVRAYVKLNSGEILYGDVKCITAPAMKGQ